jgi:hypothetical protein
MVSRRPRRDWIWLLLPGTLLCGCPVAVDDRYALEPENSGAGPGSCRDAVKNGTETDVDCGGPDCASCAAGKQCREARDCRSTLCEGNQCQPQNCTDQVKNGTETDVDCGGPDCPHCATGLWCIVGTDCVSGSCTSGLCD